MTIKQHGGVFGRNPTFNNVTIDGTLSGLSNLSLSGNLVLASGQGIDFAATAGTGTSELFNDYEEGTWTGKVADAASGGNESPTSVYGTYTKIGRMVYVQFNVTNIDTTGLTAGSDVYITGLPFATASVAGNAKFTGTAHMSVVTFSDMPFLNADESATVLRLLENRSGLGVDFVTVSELSSGTSDIHGNLCYQAA